MSGYDTASGCRWNSNARKATVSAELKVRRKGCRWAKEIKISGLFVTSRAVGASMATCKTFVGAVLSREFGEGTEQTE